MGRLVVAFCAASCLMNIGCAPRPDNLPTLGQVTGRVTLDGEPLKDAEIIFFPDGRTRSRDTTDADGRYELLYGRDHQKGAVLGGHSVVISKPFQPYGEELPFRYNIATTLRRRVEEGHNVFDFELTSDAPPAREPTADETADDEAVEDE